MVAKYYTNRVNINPHTEPVELALEIAFITDTHLRYGVDSNPSAPESGESGNRKYYAANSKVRNFTDKLTGLEDLIVHGGDACDTPSDWDWFMGEWNNLPEPKIFCLGNHDLDDLTYQELAEKFGYTEELGGSFFNKSFALNGIRILVLDCQYTQEDPPIHTSFYQTRATDEGVAWLKNELITMPEKVAVIFSHNSPHYFQTNSYYKPADAYKVSDALNEVSVLNPLLKNIPWFSGHAHIVEYQVLSNLSDKSTGYRMPDSIEFWNNDINSVNGFSGIEIYSDGSVIISPSKLEYPYP